MRRACNIIDGKELATFIASCYQYEEARSAEQIVEYLRKDLDKIHVDDFSNMRFPLLRGLIANLPKQSLITTPYQGLFCEACINYLRNTSDHSHAVLAPLHVVVPFAHEPDAPAYTWPPNGKIREHALTVKCSMLSWSIPNILTLRGKSPSTNTPRHYQIWRS